MLGRALALHGGERRDGVLPKLGARSRDRSRSRYRTGRRGELWNLPRWLQPRSERQAGHGQLRDTLRPPSSTMRRPKFALDQVDQATTSSRRPLRTLPSRQRYRACPRSSDRVLRDELRLDGRISTRCVPRARRSHLPAAPAPERSLESRESTRPSGNGASQQPDAGRFAAWSSRRARLSCGQCVQSRPHPSNEKCHPASYRKAGRDPTHRPPACREYSVARRVFSPCNSGVLIAAASSAWPRTSKGYRGSSSQAMSNSTSDGARRKAVCRSQRLLASVATMASSPSRARTADSRRRSSSKSTPILTLTPRKPWSIDRETLSISSSRV